MGGLQSPTIVANVLRLDLIAGATGDIDNMGIFGLTVNITDPNRPLRNPEFEPMLARQERARRKRVDLRSIRKTVIISR
jgi:hypothetical protein